MTYFPPSGLDSCHYPSAIRFKKLIEGQVYHVDSGSQEPVGGAARFQTLVNYYRRDGRFKGQSELLTIFSGDAFNPSLESSVTKGGSHGQLNDLYICKANVLSNQGVTWSLFLMALARM
jgi:hypothetical protein